MPPVIAEILANRKWETPPRDKRSTENIVSGSRFDRMVGKRYANCTISNYHAETPEAFEIQKRVAAVGSDIVTHIQAGTNLIWIGTVGTGKDHLMTSLLRAAIQSGSAVMWLNAVTLWQDCKACWNKSGSDVEDILKPLINSPVLALSDPYPLDGQLDRHERQWLYQIIDGRYRAMRPTWVTLNAENAADAGAVLGAQVVDRLRDGAIIFECRWKSHRKATT